MNTWGRVVIQSPLTDGTSPLTLSADRVERILGSRLPLLLLQHAVCAVVMAFIDPWVSVMMMFQSFCSWLRFRSGTPALRRLGFRLHFVSYLVHYAHLLYATQTDDVGLIYWSIPMVTSRPSIPLLDVDWEHACTHV